MNCENLHVDYKVSLTSISSVRTRFDTIGGPTKLIQGTPKGGILQLDLLQQLRVQGPQYEYKMRKHSLCVSWANHSLLGVFCYCV